MKVARCYRIAIVGVLGLRCLVFRIAVLILGFTRRLSSEALSLLFSSRFFFRHPSVFTQIILEVKGWSNRVVFAYGLWNEPLPSVFV